MNYALPGLAAGIVGLVAGIGAIVVDQPALAAVAGGFALAAGVAGVGLARRVERLEAQIVLLDAERAATAQLPAVAAPADRTGGDASGSGRPGDANSAEASSLVDGVTELFNEEFFSVALDSRIAAARRHLRPVAMVLIEVVEGLPAGEPTPIEPTFVAEHIRSTVREADTACRLRNGYFAILLEDTPENGAIWTVERIRRKLIESRDGLTVWAGIACYPAHAFSPNEIVTAAEQALVAAREWPQDRIEVAAAAE